MESRGCSCVRVGVVGRRRRGQRVRLQPLLHRVRQCSAQRCRSESSLRLHVRLHVRLLQCCCLRARLLRQVERVQLRHERVVERAAAHALAAPTTARRGARCVRTRSCSHRRHCHCHWHRHRHRHGQRRSSGVHRRHGHGHGRGCGCGCGCVGRGSRPVRRAHPREHRHAVRSGWLHWERTHGWQQRRLRREHGTSDVAACRSGVES